MNLYGRKYVIEHVVTEFQLDMEDRRYKAYITDALMILTKNTANFAGGNYLNVRWGEKFIQHDTRTGDEIAADVLLNSGLKVKGSDK